MEIEVEWVCSIKSGITTIELSDLDCISLQEWERLDKKEQEKRLNKALIEYDGAMVVPLAKEWD